MSERFVVIDDHLLLRVLLGDEPVDIRPHGGWLCTTGLWYHRLCRALANPAIEGALSRQLGQAGPTVGASAVQAVIELPDTIRIVPLRELAWHMARLVRDGVALNLLSLEALAAAEHHEAEICLAAIDANQPLLAAASVRGVPTRLIDA